MRTRKAIRALLHRVDEFLSCLRRLRRHQDAETIHDFRVAARNLLAVYALFPHESHPEKWQKKIRKRLRGFNRLRDLQAIDERIKGHKAILMVDTLCEVQDLDPTSGKRAGRKLARQLKRSKKIARQCIRLHPQELVERLGNEWFDIHRRLSARLAAADSMQAESLHKLRVAYKAFRYLVCFLHDAGELPMLDKSKANAWQARLGEIQDREVAAGWLQDHHLHEDCNLQVLAAESARLSRRFLRRHREFRRFIDGIVW